MPDATAAVLTESGRLELRTFPLPELRPGEVLVRVALCTVCGSDLHTFEGRRPTGGPTVLGHETLGVVEEVAGEVAAYGGRPVRPGDPVVWSLAVPCGSCPRCRRGLPQKCRRLVKYGHAPLAGGHALSGGLATHCRLRAGTHICHVPAGLPDAVACPAACATATVAAAFRQSGPVGGRHVLVLGAGMLGLTAAAYARDHGAAAVLVLDRDAGRLRRAGEFGATGTLDAACGDADISDLVRAATGGEGADLVLELTGSAELTRRAFDWLAVGGQFVWLGAVFPTPAVPVAPEQVIRNHWTVRGVHNYHPDDLAAALAWLAGAHRRYPFAGLVAGPLPLAQVAEAFQLALRERPPRVAVAPGGAGRAGDLPNRAPAAYQ